MCKKGINTSNVLINVTLKVTFVQTIRQKKPKKGKQKYIQELYIFSYISHYNVIKYFNSNFVSKSKEKDKLLYQCKMY